MKSVSLCFALLLSCFCYAQNANKVPVGIFYVADIECSFDMKFGEVSIEREDTICRSFYNQQGNVVYQILSKDDPSLSGTELGFSANDIESAMTHEMEYSSAPSKKYTRFYRYGANNQLDSIYTFTYEGKLTQLRKFKYDRFGISVEDVYDAKNNLVARIKNNRSADGRHIEHTEYNGNGSERAKEYFELNAVGDTVLYRNRFGATHFTYDKSHRLTSNYIRKEYQQRYNYDDKGNCVLAYPYRFGAFSKSWVAGFPKTRYEYEYDEKGNWITKKTYDVKTDVMSELTHISKRDILYPKNKEKAAKLIEDIEKLFERHMEVMKGK